MRAHLEVNPEFERTDATDARSGWNMATKEREKFTFTVEMLPGWRGTPIGRLRSALKVLLRSFGLRCTSVEPSQAADGQDERIGQDDAKLHSE